MKKSRAPRTPYIPPAARGGTSAGSRGVLLNTNEDCTKQKVDAVGCVRVSGSTTELGLYNGHRKASSQDCTHQRSTLAPTSSKTATPTAATTTSPTTTAAAAAVVVAVEEKDPKNRPNDATQVKACDAFNRQCSVESCDEGKSSAHQTEVALDCEVEGASKGRGRRKTPRKAWSQYVPPGRRVGEGDDQAPLKPVLRSSGGALSSQPALSTAAEGLPKGALSPTTDASDVQDGSEEAKDPVVEHAEGKHQRTLVKVNGSTVAVATAGNDSTAEGVAREGSHEAANDNVSPEIEHPATEPQALHDVPEGISGALPLHAPCGMFGGACFADKGDDDLSDALVTGAPSWRPAQAGGEPVAAEPVTETGIPKPPTNCSEGMTSERDHRVESSAGTSVATDTEAGASRPNPGNDVVAETGISSMESGDTKTGDGETRPKPTAKTTFERYVPPGRRKLIDAAVAAGNDGADGATQGMGPLWTSRAPVRVSQRARPSDREASPPRPVPARVAGAVSGGMSAYGANISEYSEHMSRDQVERCTAHITNFPASLPPGQREPMLKSFVALGALIVWPRPDEALATFATPALARQAVSSKTNRSSILVVQLLSEAREEKRRALQRVELARPGRPPADVSSATRLISGALGIRRPRAKPTAAPIRQSASASSATVRVRGRGAKTAQQQQQQQQPAETTDSWDM